MGIQIQAVIFDYGNVLSAPQPRAEIEAMAALLQSPVKAFEEAYWENRDRFDEAAITPDDYWNGVAGMLDRVLSDDVRDQLIAADNQSWTHPVQVMLHWAAALRRAGLRTAILSNMPVTLRSYLDHHARWLPEFDHRTFSCDVRLKKPDREIFQHCLHALGASPAETLFHDDREENVRAAESLGIHSLCYRTPEQAQCEMKGRYRLPVPLLPQVDCGEHAAQSRSSS